MSHLIDIMPRMDEMSRLLVLDKIEALDIIGVNISWIITFNGRLQANDLQQNEGWLPRFLRIAIRVNGLGLPFIIWF